MKKDQTSRIYLPSFYCERKIETLSTGNNFFEEIENDVSSEIEVFEEREGMNLSHGSGLFDLGQIHQPHVEEHFTIKS